MYRLEACKDLIDFLNREYAKGLYRILRHSGFTPLEITTDCEWNDRNCEITSQDYNEGRDAMIYDWVEHQGFDYGVEYAGYGAEQIVLVFKDKVYKISNENVGGCVNDFISSLNNQVFANFFLPYHFEDKYNECYIYSQPRLDLSYTEKEGTLLSWKYEFENISDEYLGAFITGLIGETAAQEFDDEMNDSGFSFDIHDENWGYDKEGNIKIFDPIYAAAN